MSKLPYVTAPGNINRTFSAIKQAATPERVTQDFVQTVLKIPGGSGAQMTSFLKKLGFAGTDGTPSTLYSKFRNSSTSKKAMADAIRKAYAPLYVRNEYMHKLSGEDLTGLIMEETGLAHDAGPVGLIRSAIENLKQFADFENISEDKEVLLNSEPSVYEKQSNSERVNGSGSVGMNLSYNINLNLPATSDISVFNAIFKSLKENLLRDSDD